MFASMLHPVIASLTRSTLAVLAGIVTLTVVSFAIEGISDWLLMRLLPESFPNTAAISHSLTARLFMGAYGFASVAAGGFVAARLAKRFPLRHAIVTGAVQTALTVWAAAAMRDHAPTSTWVLTIVMALPAATVGGWLYARRKRQRADSTAA
jgi:hypothetical protein